MDSADWSDDIPREPVRGGYPDPSVLSLTGLERMRQSIRGKLPLAPIHHLTGLLLAEASPGTATCSMPASPWLLSPVGVFPAGVMPLLADAALAGSIVTTLEGGSGLATSDLTMNFLRPASPDSGTLLARSRLIHAGSRLGLSEVLVEDARGRLLAHGSTRCFIFPVSASAQGHAAPRASAPAPGPGDAAAAPDPYLRPVTRQAIPIELLDGCTGLDLCERMARRELPWPPVWRLFGLRPTQVGDGRSTWALRASAWLTSPAATVYGGVLALLAETAMTCAVHTTVPTQTAVSPLDLKVNFLRPVLPDERDLTAKASVIHRGKTMGVATVEIANADGKTMATGTSTVLILPGRSWAAARPVVPEDEAEDEGEGEGEAREKGA